MPSIIANSMALFLALSIVCLTCCVTSWLVLSGTLASVSHTRILAVKKSHNNKLSPNFQLKNMIIIPAKHVIAPSIFIKFLLFIVLRNNFI